ncbi:MAG: hypothetical protein JRF40_13475 [Deltaproteobacteria bacterium]|nr:hypothetical protein [Deltaproteobacteria bacterium]
MKFLVKNFIFLHAIFISIIFIRGTAIASSKIEIQLLKGTASLIKKSEQIPLSSGDLIGIEDMIQTGPNARVEIMLPDETATKPFRFSLKADENAWVRWNRKRDIAQKNR